MKSRIEATHPCIVLTTGDLVLSLTKAVAGLARFRPTSGLSVTNRSTQKISLAQAVRQGGGSAG